MTTPEDSLGDQASDVPNCWEIRQAQGGGVAYCDLVSGMFSGFRGAGGRQ